VAIVDYRIVDEDTLTGVAIALECNRYASFAQTTQYKIYVMCTALTMNYIVHSIQYTLHSKKHINYTHYTANV